MLIDRVGSIVGLARRVGVTEGAVRKWLVSNHPSNFTLNSLLMLAAEIERDRVLKILEQDFYNYRTALINFMNPAPALLNRFRPPTT